MSVRLQESVKIRPFCISLLTCYTFYLLLDGNRSINLPHINACVWQAALARGNKGVLWSHPHR